MAYMAKRLMGDVKEIMTQTFRDSPAVFIEEYKVPEGATAPKWPTYTALVVGPPETPYAHGFFLFRISVDSGYPNTCPVVAFLSTDGGSVRLNPNLYAGGKVCLSILGTWEGDKWRCSYSLLYLLRCLQSMVLVQDPYFNEPGTDRADRESQRRSLHYSNRIFHESMRVTVLNVLEALLCISPPAVPSMLRSSSSGATPLTDGDAPTSAPEAQSSSSPTIPDTPSGLSEVGDGGDFPFVSPDGTPVTQVEGLLSQAGQQLVAEREVSANHALRSLHAPFAPWIKRYCYVWFETYEASLSRPEVLALDHTTMKVAPFDQTSCARGTTTFQHENLLERMRFVGAALEAETAEWRREGAAIAREGVESHYYGRFLLEELRGFDVDGVMASLEDDTNPFVWNYLILSPSSPLPHAHASTSDDGAEPRPSEGHCCTNIYEQSMYRVEAVFCPRNSSEPPRLKFMQPIWHPNISPKRGVPFCFSGETAISSDERFTPRAIGRQLWDLMALPPLSSLTAAVNPEAARMCFSQKESERVLFLRRARNLAAATLD